MQRSHSLHDGAIMFCIEKQMQAHPAGLWKQAVGIPVLGDSIAGSLKMTTRWIRLSAAMWGKSMY